MAVKTGLTIDEIADRIMNDNDIPVQKKQEIYSIIALKNNGLITENDCRNRIRREMSDLPLEVIERIGAYMESN